MLAFLRIICHNRSSRETIPQETKGVALVSRIQLLKALLTRDLPLDQVGPQLRRSARQALGTGNEHVLAAACGAVVKELLRKGILVRVSLEGNHADADQYVLKRGTRELIDLQPLYGSAEAGAEFSRTSSQAQPELRHSLAQVDGVLVAMEEAQNLRLGDVQSGETTTILGNILYLLTEFTPQFKLGVLLNHIEPGSSAIPGLVFDSQADGQTDWVTLRETGHSVWIPLESELPAGIRALLKQGDSLGDNPVAVAVPIWEPRDETQGKAAAQEAGLLFVMAPGSWNRDSLLKIGGRLSRFVSNRWRHQRDVNQIIHTDALTGASNRAFFDKHFTLELERARRSDSPLTLVICDLDHFKGINDKFGHQAGDRVLQLVARKLKEELRRIDHVCRIGGEEFALILPSTSPEAGREVMARLLQTEFAEEITVDGVSVKLGVTLSYGGVTFPPDGADAFELFRKADAMLYLSKDQGRDRCHFWCNEGQHLEITGNLENPPGS